MYGFQMVAPYSMIYLTKVTYVVIRHVSGTFLKFLPRKPSVALAFLHGNIHSWLTNFLSTRTMRTIVEGESSKKTSVDSGELQGTVLGLILSSL
jgi:hypothetical protein